MTRLVVGLALLLGACTGRQASAHTVAVAVPSAGQDSLDLHFHSLSETLRAEGLGPALLLDRGFLPPSGRTAFAVQVKARECAVFAALATASMADLDAALYTAEGESLVEDDSANSRPTLTLCAGERAVDAYLTLFAYQGAGSFIAAQFNRAARPNDDLHTASAAGALSALGQLAQLLHERGFEDAAPRVELSLGDARPVRIAFNVDAGDCYTLAAEPSSGLSEVGLRLVDSQGAELVDGVSEPNLAALQYCADRRAELAVEVVARRGQGVARIARFRGTQAAVGGARALWLMEPTPSAAAWSSAKSEPATSARGPRELPFSSERVVLKQGQVLELERKRSTAPCERWEARLLPGLWRATLRVESDMGELLGEDDAEGMHACVQVCAAGRRRRITLLGRAGFGSVVLSATGYDATPAQESEGDCSGCAASDAGAGCSLSSGRR